MFIQREAKQRFLNILDSGKIAIVTGARQVGKTTLVKDALSAKSMLMLKGTSNNSFSEVARY